MTFESLISSPSASWFAWLVWISVAACIGGVLVFVGLLLETLAEKEAFLTFKVFRVWKKRKRLGEWLVVAGVGVEILSTACFAIRGELESKNLQARTITHSQESKLIEILRHSGETNVTILITFIPESSESRAYAKRIAEVLKHCGFISDSKPSIEYDSPDDPFPTGLRFEEWGIQSTPLAGNVFSAFKAVGIPAQTKIVKLNANQKDVWFIRVWLKPEK